MCRPYNGAANPALARPETRFPAWRDAVASVTSRPWPCVTARDAVLGRHCTGIFPGCVPGRLARRGVSPPRRSCHCLTALYRAGKGSEERWNVLGSTLIAERHVVELEQQIGRQRAVLDQLVGAGRSEREIDLTRSALATLESRLRFAQDHLRFERTHYSPQDWNLAK